MTWDPLSKRQRSALMAKVKGRGNLSTEALVEAGLRDSHIVGWRRHSETVLGRPDFYFPRKRVAVFVDGCFWHSCPKCRRRVPKTRRAFWLAKIEGNRRRDQRIRRRLRASGYHVLSIWEHELAENKWIARVKRMLTRATKTGTTKNP